MSTHAHRPGPAGASRTRLDLLLRPHRSLSPRGFWLLMGLLAGVSFVAGIMFWQVGAWPVVGFLGLDVALIYLAFRLSYASAHEFERIRLTADALTIELASASGTQRVEFQPHWLRVDLVERPGRQSRLLLTSHGRSHVVGSFLAPAERAQVAALLRAALADLRRPVFDAE
jgi:uncharacterized membrane protein